MEKWKILLKNPNPKYTPSVVFVKCDTIEEALKELTKAEKPRVILVEKIED